jgi:GNAT superfamily N-acetyltransferase
VAGSSWSIRRATAEDREFLAAMLVEAVNWSPEWKPKSRRRVLSDIRTAHYIAGWPRDTDLGVIAEAGSQPAGAAWVRFFPADDPGYGFVSPDVPELTIAVAARWRGRGIGRALLRAIAVLAEEAGIRRISLSVERKNFARSLYLSEGYAVADATHPQADTMVKNLADGQVPVAGRVRGLGHLANDNCPTQSHAITKQGLDPRSGILIRDGYGPGLRAVRGGEQDAFASSGSRLACLVSRRAAGLARHFGKHLGYVGFDVPLARCRGDGDPVMAVDHEMPVADAVDLDRRDRFTAALGQRQPLPAEPHPVGGGPEAPVEVAAPLGRADDGVQPDRLTPQPPLATPARRADNLIQRHEPVTVAAPNAQPVRQRGQELSAPGPKKVILDVHLQESGTPHLFASVTAIRGPISDTRRKTWRAASAESHICRPAARLSCRRRPLGIPDSGGSAGHP